MDVNEARAGAPGAGKSARTAGASLDIRGLNVGYGSTTALHSVSLSIGAGEFFCLLGPSGCGKSTLLGAIAGFIPVRNGAIVLDGRDVSSLATRQREVGVVFQSYALFPHLTAAENVAYGLKVRKVPQGTITRRVEELLELVRLGGKGTRFPRQLSGGEQQRVAIARALAVAPRLLLLDEPLSNLDARLRDEMRVELKRIQKATGVTTVFVTHDQEEAFGLGDRVAILNGGHIDQVGVPREIYKTPRTAFVAGFIGRSNAFDGVLTRTGAEADFRVGATSVRLDDARLAELPPGPHRLFLRPEELSISPPASCPNRIRGKVAEVLYGGPTATIRVSTEHGEVEVCGLSENADAMYVGDCVEIGWQADAGFFVNATAA
ncbi:ABC transporter ATP-binding protein [Pigmentiphaga soli]